MQCCVNDISAEDAVALYVLDSCQAASDSSQNGNDGEVFGARYSIGPKGEPGRSAGLMGTESSYVTIKNNGSLDTKYSISILMQVYPMEQGLLFNYGNNEYGLNLAFLDPGKLKFTVREREKSPGFAEEAESNALVKDKWNYIAATFDYNTATAKIFIDGKEAGKFVFAKQRLIETSQDVRLGNIAERGFNFKGLISCVQVYDRALTASEIGQKRQCPAGPGSPLAGLFFYNFICIFYFYQNIWLNTGLIYFIKTYFSQELYHIKFVEVSKFSRKVTNLL